MKAKFNIGDKVWISVAGNHHQIWITCPDCLGQKFLTVITGDGSKHTIDCECCKSGYEGCRGQIITYGFVASARETIIDNIEIRDRKTRYNYQDECDVFETKEEAEAHAESLRTQHALDEANRLHCCKENPKKSWAWNATYHRRELKDALRNVEYHTAKLDVAKLKSKEPSQ